MKQITDIVKQYWGFDAFMPLQREATQCVMEERDSLVVLPTGGGKSLCFQAPALAMSGMAVVVSPLLSLMKDQVDALRANGVPAARIDSTMTAAERRSTHDAIQARRMKLLYVSPERMAQPNFIAYLQVIGVAYFVVDEAHCISHWGHDFRPEYREMRALHDNFPDTAIHAYTATATNQVRRDIISQLHLRDPAQLVGNFDRPNLNYRVQKRAKGVTQIMETVDAHKGEPGIIYCLRRTDVDTLSDQLTAAGYKALPYHAGMNDIERKRNQDAFSNDEVDIIVATIAFGMGIDKSNVRFVLHTAMPKSIEHYQQETGRAGRDGLPADCCLLYSYQDFMVWKNITGKMEDDKARRTSQQKLREMLGYSQGFACRHKALSEYFGQPYANSRCDACDVCLEQFEKMENSGEIAGHIFRAVNALGDIAGPRYTTLVLTGSEDERIKARRHNKCASYSALSAYDEKTVRDWIEQMTQQGYLEKQGEYSILYVTSTGHDAFTSGEGGPQLMRPAPKTTGKKATRAAAAPVTSDQYDAGLFDALKKTRLETARKNNVPPFVVFSDATLRDMARRMPDSYDTFLSVQGVGEKKREAFADRFLEIIRVYRNDHPDTTPVKSNPSDSTRKPNPSSEKAGALFEQGRSIAEVAEIMKRSPSTVEGYIVEYFYRQKRTNPEPWITPDTMDAVRRAFTEVDGERLKPVFEKLNGEIPYWQIRLCKVCLENQSEEDTAGG